MREHVTYPKDSECAPDDFDRLFGQLHGGAAQPVQSGEIRIEGAFQVPLREPDSRYLSGQRNSAQVEIFWVIKVRADSGTESSTASWKEYKLNVLPPTATPRADDARSATAELYDVFLTDAPMSHLLAISKQMGALLPHLDSGQIGSLQAVRPALLCERLTESGAKAFQQRLETAGATVVTRPTLEGYVPRPVG